MSSNPSHIVITGATGGIGQALALAYAMPGIRLSLFGRKEAVLQNLAQQCQKSGAEVFIYPMDLRNTPELMNKIEAIDAEKPVDLIIANAGVATYLDSELEVETWEQIEQAFDINLTSTIATIHPLIQRMRQRQKGQIALMSSMAAYRGIAISPSYCASKAGVKAYGESLRLLLKKDNVGVSVICPGFVESAMSNKFPGKKPFLLTAQRSALKIKKGLKANKANITFPFFLGFGTRLLPILPGFFCEFIFQRLAYSRS